MISDEQLVDALLDHVDEYGDLGTDSRRRRSSNRTWEKIGPGETRVTRPDGTTFVVRTYREGWHMRMTITDEGDGCISIPA